MGSPTCLTDPSLAIVLDASAAINICASGCAADLIRAIRSPVLVVDEVPAELEEGRRRGRKEMDELESLITGKLVQVVALQGSAEAVFESLVIGDASHTLDDGEAATIAYAVSHSAIAIIDERKALRICGERFPALLTGCTVDLFANELALSSLGTPRIAKALFDALQIARMRVLPHHVDWVVGLIGTDQAGKCASLPKSARQRPI
jgi:predicted nucleic acid-binding protein